MPSQSARAVVDVAEKYYDSSEADEFYFNIWGGDDIHIGIYESNTDAIRDASRRTVEHMAAQCERLGEQTRVLDIGAGYGGAGRLLANQYGCHVTCLNLSETQNRRNRSINDEMGLGDRVDVLHGNFEEVPCADRAFDLVWSQDAILHSGNRQKVLQEVKRVLRPGGQFIFTDPMQADDCPSGVLDAVLARIHLDTLGSFEFYRDALTSLGFKEIRCEDLTKHLRRHYNRVRDELHSRYDEMVRLSTREYVDRMILGLGHWVEAADQGYLAWGVLHFERS